MGVPGLSAGGSMIQRARFSGEFRISSPAIVGRRATLSRLGPITPVAPGTADSEWQPAQPLAANSCKPRSGSLGTLGAGVSRIGAAATLARGTVAGPGVPQAAEARGKRQEARASRDAARHLSFRAQRGIRALEADASRC